MTMTTSPLTVEELERWRLFGAGWRVLAADDGHAVVQLCACTGEPVERREADDPAVLAYLAARPAAGD